MRASVCGLWQDGTLPIPNHEYVLNCRVDFITLRPGGGTRPGGITGVAKWTLCHVHLASSTGNETQV